MGRFCLTLTVVIVAAIAVGAQQPCKEYAPASSVFTFCPPDGWAATQEKDRKYLTFEKKVGPGVFPPMLMIDEQKGNGAPFELYVFGMVQGFFEPTSGPGKVTNKRVSNMGEFKTTSGIKGIKMVTEMAVDSIPTRTVYYVFEAPGPVILSFTAMNGDDESIGRIVDTAMKSLRAKR